MGKNLTGQGRKGVKALKLWRWGSGLPQRGSSRTPTPSPLVHHMAVGLQNLCAWPRLEVLGLTVGGCALALVIRVDLALEAGGN